MRGREAGIIVHLLPLVAVNGVFHFAHGCGEPGENGTGDEGVADVELREVRHGVELRQVADLDAMAGVHLRAHI